MTSGASDRAGQKNAAGCIQLFVGHVQQGDAANIPSSGPPARPFSAPRSPPRNIEVPYHGIAARFRPPGTAEGASGPIGVSSHATRRSEAVAAITTRFMGAGLEPRRALGNGQQAAGRPGAFSPWPRLVEQR